MFYGVFVYGSKIDQIKKIKKFFILKILSIFVSWETEGSAGLWAKYYGVMDIGYLLNYGCFCNIMWQTLFM